MVLKKCSDIVLFVAVTILLTHDAEAFHVHNIPQTPTSRIINGKPVHPQLIPYIVRITLDYAAVSMTGTCGGTLISDRHVLTAGHCFLFNGTVEKIEFGAHKENNLETFKTVQYGGTYVKHPGENININSHDIAIITLTSPVKIDNHYIAIANLPEKKDEFNTYLGETVQAYGWGMINDDPGEDPTELMGIDLNVIEYNDCYDLLEKAMRPEIAHLYDYEICTSGSSKKSSEPVGTCHGDSGGPLVYNGTLIGVTSRSATWYCSHRNPDVFVSVGRHLAWIKQQLSK